MNIVDKFIHWLIGDGRKCTTRKCYVNIDEECCYVAFSPKKCSESNKPDHRPNWVI